MEIIQKEKNGIVCVTVKGRKEAGLTREFKEVVKQIVEGDKRRLLIDLGALQYHRSSVLLVILNPVKEINLCALSSHRKQLFYGSDRKDIGQ